jgi:DNA gyrase/topoisomerase IV subunit B
MKNLNLEEFILVKPDSIEKINGFKNLVDIEVEDDNTFFIKGENKSLILSHNCDGDSITALLINFLFKYWPELFEHRMVYRAETPIVVVKNNKTKKKIPFYTQNEYNDWLKKNNAKDYEIKYKKGLAALVDDEYQEIINNPRLTLLKKDSDSAKYLNIWFGKDSDLRKEEMLK